ncbi:hypothetical protein L798_04174 [Zootermopsis nevadensis]|uniref:Uncharacterized protein n=1 Tax=Zootermopsis nevadensis TaxID=136037 RepID=A0A067RCV9_ZOONE|nr:hypothetical protein L798_04174 [Zootermopsis nevadensis]
MYYLLMENPNQQLGGLWYISYRMCINYDHIRDVQIPVPGLGVGLQKDVASHKVAFYVKNMEQELKFMCIVIDKYENWPLNNFPHPSSFILTYQGGIIFTGCLSGAGAVIVSKHQRITRTVL